MQRSRKNNPFSSHYDPVDPDDDDQIEYEYEDDDINGDEDHKVFGLGILQADDRQPAYGQGVVISLLSATALLLLAIITVGEGDGSDPPIFQQTTTLFWIISVIVLILTAAGAQYAERTAAAAAAEVVDSGRPSDGLATAWAVPFLSVFAAIVLTATYHNRWMLLVGPLIAFLGTAGALLSRDLLDEADEESSRIASTIHTLVVHAIAFLAFSAVYLNKFETWIAAPLVGIIAGILILETLERVGISAPPRVFYAIIGGWVLSQVMIALNWWPTWGWTGGAVLLAVFYAVAGLLLVRVQRTDVRKRDLMEYGAVAGTALIILVLRDLMA